MLNLPESVQTALENLRKEYSFFVSLKKINGKYYLYKQTSVWNKEKKKLRVISTYLGKITDEGVFVKKEVTHKDELENAKALILAHGGKVLLPKIEEGIQIPITELTPDEVDKRILMTLSMNARASLAFLSRQCNLSQTATYNRVKRLERKFGIRYLPEINVNKLGYSEFLIAVKFTGEIPSTNLLKDTFLKEPRVQFAIVIKGDYDVLLYVLAKTSKELTLMLHNIRSEAILKYSGIWNCIELDKSFGYVPIRKEFIDLLKTDLLQREYAVLKELTNDGAKEFTEIDKLYGFDEGRSQYTYHKLLEKGFLERITITLENLNVKYFGVIFLSKIDKQEFEKNRLQFLTYIMKGVASPFDKYLYRANMAAPDGSVCIMPIYKDGELEAESDKYLDLKIGVKIKSEISISQILGSVCLRVSDVSHSQQQAALVRDFGFKELKKINYFETGRKSRKQ